MRPSQAIYVAFTDLDSSESGDHIRPLKMKEALESRFDLICIFGSTYRKRWRSFRQAIQKINHPRLCYYEAGGPIFRVSDYIILVYLRLVVGAKIGVFYRDAYWKFAPWAQPKKQLARWGLWAIRAFEFWVLRSISHKMFFPSGTMMRLLGVTNGGILPPGSDPCPVVGERTTSRTPTAIYVGGFTKRYGMDLMMEALRRVNERRFVKLTLIVREKEYCRSPYYGQDYPWLEVIHASGDSLPYYYAQANFGIIGLRRNTYNDLAVPVKLFEYFTFGLPVVSTACTEIASILHNRQAGIAVDDDVGSFAQGILTMITCIENGDYRHVQSIRTQESWDRRVETILSELGS